MRSGYRKRMFLIAILFVLFTSASQADEWRSKDEKISLTRPNPERFGDGESTPPMSAIWVSPDESLKLAVIEMDNKKRFTVDRRSMEQAFAKEIGGRISGASTKEVSGFPTYTMTAVGKVGNSEIEAKQMVIVIDDKVFKVMAIGVGTKVEGVEDVDSLFASLKIHAEPTSEVPKTTTPASQNNGKDLLDDKQLVDSISGKVGAAGVFLLMGVGILLWLRSSKRRSENGA